MPDFQSGWQGFESPTLYCAGAWTGLFPNACGAIWYQAEWGVHALGRFNSGPLLSEGSAQWWATCLENRAKVKLEGSTPLPSS